MREPRNTIKYIVRQDGETVHKGITDRDLRIVEREQQNKFPDSEIVKVGNKTTRDQALEWRRKKDCE